MCDTITSILTIFTAVTSLIAAVSSLISASQRNKIDSLSEELNRSSHKNTSLKNELYNVYLNVDELLKIENKLLTELEIGKITARKGHQTNRYIHPKHVQTRIAELGKDLT